MVSYKDFGNYPPAPKPDKGGKGTVIAWDPCMYADRPTPFNNIGKAADGGNLDGPNSKPDTVPPEW